MAVVQHDEAVAVLNGIAHVVRDHQRGELALAHDAVSELHDLGSGLRVEGCGVLIEQQQLGALERCHQQRERLALAAGERRDLGGQAGLKAEAETAEQLTVLLLFFFRHAPGKTAALAAAGIESFTLQGDTPLQERAELVRRLLEYKMYKYMAQELEEREQEAELLFFKEPTIPREVAKYEEPLDLDKLLDGLTLAKLQKVFDAVMKRNANKLDPVRSRFSTIRREPISLEQKVKSVLSYAREHRHFKFSDVLERESDRLEIVVAFLAVLELMKMGRIHLVQEKLFDEMQLDTVDVDETEDEAELELSTEEGEEYARIR